MAGAQETITESLTACTLGGEEPAGAPVARKMLPGTDNPLVIRTDFSDQQAWEAIVTAITATSTEGFKAYVDLLDDPAFQGITATQVLGSIPEEYSSRHGFLMLVDHVTISELEHPILLVNLDAEYDAEYDDGVFGRQFRAVPSAIQGIENNVSVATMNFEDFAENVDEDGVFRDFREPTRVGTELPTE